VRAAWRVGHTTICIGCDAPFTLQRIDPASGSSEATFSSPQGDSDRDLNPRGGLGVAYDQTRDLLYVSICHQGCSPPFTKGEVLIVDPSTGAVTGELFRTFGFMTVGLAYDPVTDTLWVGDGLGGPVRNLDRAGNVLSSFPRPSPGGAVDGLEFIRLDRDGGTARHPARRLTLLFPCPPTAFGGILRGRCRRKTLRSCEPPSKRGTRETWMRGLTSLPLT
jgi:hypothetical protein